MQSRMFGRPSSDDDVARGKLAWQRFNKAQEGKRQLARKMEERKMANLDWRGAEATEKLCRIWINTNAVKLPPMSSYTFNERAAEEKQGCMQVIDGKVEPIIGSRHLCDYKEKAVAVADLGKTLEEYTQAIFDAVSGPGEDFENLPLAQDLANEIVQGAAEVLSEQLIQSCRCDPKYVERSGGTWADYE